MLMNPETIMEFTINTTYDFLEALPSDPDFRNAARREILTESLIGLPGEITKFRAEMYQRTERIQGYLNDLSGYDVEMKMPSDLRRQVERRFGLTGAREHLVRQGLHSATQPDRALQLRR